MFYPIFVVRYSYHDIWSTAFNVYWLIIKNRLLCIIWLDWLPVPPLSVIYQFSFINWIFIRFGCDHQFFVYSWNVCLSCLFLVISHPSIGGWHIQFFSISSVLMRNWLFFGQLDLKKIFFFDFCLHLSI